MKQFGKGFSWVIWGKLISWTDRFGIWIVCILLFFATVFWFFGLDAQQTSRFPKALFYALQFIFLNKDVQDNEVSNIALRYGLNITQFAIPFFAYSTIFLKVFQDRVVPSMKRRKVARLKGHHVIVGYGAFGHALSRELFRRQESIKEKSRLSVVTIDKQDAGLDNDAEPIRFCYDALQVKITEETNMQSAGTIYLLLPEERDNLSVLQNIIASCSLLNHPKIYIRTGSIAMQHLLMDWVGIRAFDHEQMDVRSLNPYEIAARGIVNMYPPDMYGPTDKNGPVAQVVMIVGASEMAKALVLRFARIGIFSPEGKLQVVWAGDGVKEAFNELKASYPALETDYSELNSWDNTRSTSEEYFDSVLPPINICLVNEPAEYPLRRVTIDGICDAMWPSAIYVCHDSDIRNLDEARDIQAALCKHPDALEKGEKESNKRLILAAQSKSVLGVVDGDHKPVLQAVPYHIEEVSLDSIFAKTVAEDRADELAKGFHGVYAKNDDIDKEWAQMPFFLKESNRDLADHLAIKARYAGINADTVKACVFNGRSTISDADRQLMEDKRDDLIIMEKRRYRAFMFMNGFTHGSHSTGYHVDNEQDGKELDRCLRVNATLLEDDLSLKEKVKDEKIVAYSMDAMENRRRYASKKTDL